MPDPSSELALSPGWLETALIMSSLALVRYPSWPCLSIPLQRGLNVARTLIVWLAMSVSPPAVFSLHIRKSENTFPDRV